MKKSIILIAIVALLVNACSKSETAAEPSVDDPGPPIERPWIEANFEGDVETAWKPDGHGGCGPMKDEKCWSWTVTGTDSKDFQWPQDWRDGPMNCRNIGIGNSFVLGTKPHEDFMTAEIVGNAGNRALELAMIDDDRDSQHKSRMEFQCGGNEDFEQVYNAGGFLRLRMSFPIDQHEQSCASPTGWCWRQIGEVYTVNEADPISGGRITYGLVKRAHGEPWRWRITSDVIGGGVLEGVWQYQSEQLVPVGKQFVFEYEFVADSAVGAEDGTVKLWVDGELIFDVVGTTWVKRKTWDVFGLYTNSNLDACGEMKPSRERIYSVEICSSREVCATILDTP